MYDNNFNVGSHLTELKIGSKNYFKVKRPVCQPLLLPDEHCLAEDEQASFDLHVDRVGFHLFRSDAWFINLRAKIYLTNYRVRNLSYQEASNPKLIFIPLAKGKPKYLPFSICIEAIRKPHLGTITFPSTSCLEFMLCLDHAAYAIKNCPEISGTVGDFFEQLFVNKHFDPLNYRSCEVYFLCEFHQPLGHV
jgi:hypothetical protein